MGERRRYVALLCASVGAVAIALFLGAAERSAADTVSDCAGKPLCVAVTDQAQASRTPPGGPDHFLTDTVVVSNGGTSSNLVNLALTISWSDVGAATTTEYRPAFSDSRCTAGTQANTIVCTLPKSLGPEAAETFSLVFRTATNASATAFNLSATATAKEQSKPSKGGAPPNDAVITVSNTTTYEGDPDQDVSIGGGGISTTLATQQTGAQFSKLSIPAGAPRDLYQIVESACPAGTTCIGQFVTTIAVGLHPVNLQITYTGPLPNGTSENKIVVLHTRDGDSEPTVIDQRCGGDLFSGSVEEDEIPCRRVEITRLDDTNYRLEVDAWDHENGGWGVG